MACLDEDALCVAHDVVCVPRDAACFYHEAVCLRRDADCSSDDAVCSTHPALGLNHDPEDYHVTRTAPLAAAIFLNAESAEGTVPNAMSGGSVAARSRAA